MIAPERPALRNAACTACALHKTARTVCVGYDGSATPDILFVGQNPGRNEDVQGVPFVGESGQRLRSMLRTFPDNISWALTNAAKCYTPGNREPTGDEVEACRPYLLAELRELRPLVVVALGVVAFKALTGGGSITQNRGRPAPLRAPLRKALGESAPQVLAAWHPMYVIREPARVRELEEDLAGAVRFVRSVRGEEQGETVAWHENPIYPSAPVWAFDIETTGLNYSSPDFRIHCIGIDDGSEGGVSVIRDPKMIPHVIADLERRNAEGLVNVGHHSIGFDAPALNLEYPIACDDTQLLDYLCDESASSHTLQAAALRWLYVPPWKDDVTWKWESFDPQGPDWEKAAQYNARDVRYTHRLYTTLRQRLDDRQYLLYEKLLKPAARMFERIHRTGIYLNRENLAKATRDVEGRLVIAQRVIDDRARDLGVEPFNARSYAKVGALLYDGLKLPVVSWTEGGARSTDAETLQALRLARTTPPEALPVLDALLDFRETDALWSRYLKTADGFIESDGRAHPSYSLTATMTGRTACYGFGIQRWPRDAALRRCIAAPPGRKLIVCDLSQIELRTMGFLSREPHLLELYRSGLGDAHAAMAERIVRLRDGLASDVPAVWTKDDRYIAKPVNFGCLYGADPPTLQAYALKVYGIRLTMTQCEVLRNEGFFGLWSELPVYYEAVLKELKTTGEVRSPLGRRRRLENIHATDQALRAAALREGINTPNQGLASDIALLGTLCADMIPDLDTVAFIHDAAIFECDDSLVEERAPLVRDAFEKMAVEALQVWFGVDFDVPLVADVKIAQEWSL
jgi:uracil-DNA glycosylase family 4